MYVMDAAIDDGCRFVHHFWQFVENTNSCRNKLITLLFNQIEQNPVTDDAWGGGVYWCLTELPYYSYCTKQPKT